MMVSRQTQPWIYSWTEFTWSNLWRSGSMYVGQIPETILKNPEKTADEVGTASSIEGEESLNWNDIILTEGQAYKMILEYKNFSTTGKNNQILNLFGKWDV